jgi:PilZ domain-containing protein
VFTPNRRKTPRFRLQTTLSFSRTQPWSEGEHKAKAINISTTGVCFATSQVMSVGEVIEVLLEIPKRVTGVTATTRRFTGRIMRIDGNESVAQGSLVSVQLLYSEPLGSKEVVDANHSVTQA